MTVVSTKLWLKCVLCAPPSKTCATLQNWRPHRAHSVTDFSFFFRFLTRLHVWATKRNAAIVFKERLDLNMYHCQHIETMPLLPPFDNIETKLFTLSFQVSLFGTNTCNLTCYTSFQVCLCFRGAGNFPRFTQELVNVAEQSSFGLWNLSKGFFPSLKETVSFFVYKQEPHPVNASEERSLLFLRFNTYRNLSFSVTAGF